MVLTIHLQERSADQLIFYIQRIYYSTCLFAVARTYNGEIRPLAAKNAMFSSYF